MTLEQWQKPWGLAEKITDKNFYKMIDKVYSQIKETFGDAPRLHQIEGRPELYRLPYRIDDGKIIYKPINVEKDNVKDFALPVADTQKDALYYYMLESKKEGDVIYKPSSKDKSTLLLQDGLLYAFDAAFYRAVTLAPDEKRVMYGYILGSAMRYLDETKRNIDDFKLEEIAGHLSTPILCENNIPFYSIGRTSKKSPEMKPSSAIAAYIEGITPDLLLREYKHVKISNPKIESPIFKKYGQKG
jgi:hypothetical protein